MVRDCNQPLESPQMAMSMSVGSKLVAENIQHPETPQAVEKNSTETDWNEVFRLEAERLWLASRVQVVNDQQN